MIQKIKNLIMAVSLLAVFAAPVLAPATATYAMPKPAYADNTGFSPSGNECGGSNFELGGGTTNTNGCSDATGATGGFSEKIKKFLNILSAVVGVVAVIMIIYAGFRYVTSAGSEGGVKTAKNAIIYAIIGLVVVALAQLIVHFVVSNVT